MTKILVAAVFCALFSLVNYAQDNSIEKSFDLNKARYKMEKFSEGEDATSGYDYFVYKDKAKIVKIREIWSSSQKTTCGVKDFYFNDGKLTAIIKYTFDSKYYKTAEKGRNIPLKMYERLVFTESRLTGWTEKGKPVSKDDQRWAETEKEALEDGKSQLENYKWMKESD